MGLLATSKRSVDDSDTTRSMYIHNEHARILQIEKYKYDVEIFKIIKKNTKNNKIRIGKNVKIKIIVKYLKFYLKTKRSVLSAIEQVGKTRSENLSGEGK